MKARLKNKSIWIIIIVLIAIAVVLVLMVPKKEKSFDIKDRCGLMPNLITHTVQDEGACRAQCKAQCETMDLLYSRIEFEESAVGCHSCVCFCIEK